MQTEMRETAPLERELEIRVPADEVARFVDSLISAYRRRYEFRGFRPGKAPDAVVRARFREEIEGAIAAELVPRSIEQALAEHTIHPAAPGDVRDLHHARGEDLTFTFRVDIWPRIELAPYEGVEVTQVVEEVSEAQVDRMLEMIRDRAAVEEVVERPAAPGDLVDAEVTTIDASGEPVAGGGSERVRLEVDSDGLLPEFRTAVAGIAPGETRELEVTYPDDYHAEELQGQKRRYRMRAVEIREKKRPPLDDNLAGKVAPGADLAELRRRVRQRLEAEARSSARGRLEETIVERLIADNPFDLPEVVVRRPLERLRKRFEEDGRQIGEAELERAYRPQIERLRRRDFLLGKVAEREGIVVGEAEVEEEVARLARSERKSVDAVRRELGEMDRFRDFLFERRVFDALIEKLRVREVQRPAPPADRAGAEGAAPGKPAAAPAPDGDVVDAEFPESGD
ncbi:MAG: trigger factor [Candidatus Eisenbacteria bacterium]|nr:trigger factor [Candidatus Eisenbacteria bacterium]